MHQEARNAGLFHILPMAFFAQNQQKLPQHALKI